MSQTVDPTLGLYRNLTTLLADLSNVALSSTARLQHTQLTATQELLASQSSLHRQLADASSLHEALDVQGQAAQDSWTKTISALGEICAASSVNQVEWIRRTQSQTLQFIDGIESSLNEFPGDSMPLMNAAKLTIHAARTACEANIRATEEAAKLATNKFENVLPETAIVSGKRQAA